MRLLVAVNPGASRAEAALDELATWFGENCEAVFITTHSQDDLKRILLHHGPAADRIVIGGGDGTISNALPELLQLDKPLAVLPLGTANDFARSLGLPQDSIAAARVALNGRTHKVDVGLVNGRPFVNVASVGVAARVSQAQSKVLKRSWRILSYFIGLLRVVHEARPFYIELTIDEAPPWFGAVYQVSIGNGRYHGDGLTVAEHAAIDDGKLNLYVVLPGTFLAAAHLHRPSQVRLFGARGFAPPERQPPRYDPHLETPVGQRRRRDQRPDTRGVHPTPRGTKGDGATEFARRSSRP